MDRIILIRRAMGKGLTLPRWAAEMQSQQLL
jgi:hypothetical protein